MSGEYRASEQGGERMSKRTRPTTQETLQARHPACYLIEPGDDRGARAHGPYYGMQVLFAELAFPGARRMTAGELRTLQASAGGAGAVFVDVDRLAGELLARAVDDGRAPGQRGDPDKV